MISEHLAAELRDAGLRWKPAAGDRFVIPQPGLEGEVFTLSEMTIEARQYPSGTILGFNGTTEWALDSVAQDDALWMPREDQLRELLGGTFVSLLHVGELEPDTPVVTPTPVGTAHIASPMPRPAGTWVVTTRTPSGEEADFGATNPADAYGLAVLALVRHALEDVRA
ncbi:pilus assembly protein CpaE [Actinotalea subterranea]|uniref:pilus assembly protein CpaE n=1 Tax=Actinotalea subterranea TaxID=2607497 RepID=UPI0011ED8A0D|nr:pilus assembly protein CpaE [Actinotalea subterranea]